MNTTCGRCHRPLRNPRWREIGYGKVCYSKVQAESARGNEDSNQTIGAVLTGLVNGYVGMRTKQGLIINEVIGGRQVPLKHQVLHSPTGMEWGYGGSGPADLAYSILCTVTDPETAERYHKEFKWDFVAGFDRDRWELDRHQVESWLAERLAERLE
ncbi:DUF6166 domain-containing protein [Alicyclobacillus macrosporangiidus]|uniref:DUF6166 domain-containing protein n=1 Tax=Alicyclobacillus macrosporangiidus TaxID=392015 RepID=UPI00111395BF|nr:DUF6166 domain-containing protein [Alicyclobacillus macrosporangiidus]